MKEELRRELDERDRKYEDLRQHLLEVEETTMDTVGWLAGVRILPSQSGIACTLPLYCMHTGDKTDAKLQYIRSQTFSHSKV